MSRQPVAPLEEFARRYREGQSVGEIAAELGVAVQTVRNRISRARAAGMDVGPSRAPSGKAMWETASMYRQGMSPREIAEARGCSTGSVYALLRYAGVKIKRAPADKDKPTLEEIASLYRQGMTAKEIAGKLDRKLGTVEWWIQKARSAGIDLSRPEQDRPGPGEAIELCRQGVPVAEIAEKCGRAAGTVSNWLREAEKRGEIKRRRPGRQERYTSAEIEAMRRAGKSVKDIAEATGYSTWTVKNKLYEARTLSGHCGCDFRQDDTDCDWCPYPDCIASDEQIMRWSVEAGKRN